MKRGLTETELEELRKYYGIAEPDDNSGVIQLECGTSMRDYVLRRPGRHSADLSHEYRRGLISNRHPFDKNATATIIHDGDVIPYPHTMVGQVQENADKGTSTFGYQRDFLLQFMGVCRQFPWLLPQSYLSILDLQPVLPSPRALAPRGRRAKGPIPAGQFPKEPSTTFDRSRRQRPVNSRAEGLEATATRQVRSLLNKLTQTHFDRTVNRVLSWINKSDSEIKPPERSRLLLAIVRTVVDQATNDAENADLYARLCPTIYAQVSPSIQDDSYKDARGQPVAGGQLFRKYLLNDCQREFEVNFGLAEPAVPASAPQKAEALSVSRFRRRRIGIITFMAALFKVSFLSERIMHEAIKRLLNNETPDVPTVASLRTLFFSIGKALDTQRAGPYMDIYFSRTRAMQDNLEISPQIRFMLADILELRERKWEPRRPLVATVTQSTEDASQQKPHFQRTYWRRGRGGAPQPQRFQSSDAS